MSAAKQPQPLRRPKLTAEAQTEMICNEMLLLHHFPDHVQAEEFRRNIRYAAEKLPALHAHAEIIVQGKIAEDGRLRVHPEECPRCKGTGRLTYHGRIRFCGCPAGETACQTSELPDPQPPRLEAALKPLSARQQLRQLRSLFDGSTNDDDTASPIPDDGHRTVSTDPGSKT